MKDVKKADRQGNRKVNQYYKGGQAGRPVAAPSANISGRVSPTKADRQDDRKASQYYKGGQTG